MRWLLKFLFCTVLTFFIILILWFVVVPVITSFLLSVIPDTDTYAGVIAFITQGEFSWEGVLILSVIGGFFLSVK